MKKNAFFNYFCKDSRTWSRILNIPTEAIREADFNTDNTIYVKWIDGHHIVLTQDGSDYNIVSKVNGWLENGRKRYRIGVESKFLGDLNSVSIVPNGFDNTIDIFGCVDY